MRRTTHRAPQLAECFFSGLKHLLLGRSRRLNRHRKQESTSLAFERAVELLEDRTLLSNSSTGASHPGLVTQQLDPSIVDVDWLEKVGADGLTIQVANFSDGVIPDVAQDQILFLSSATAPTNLQVDSNENIDAADSTNADQLAVGGSSGLNLTGAGLTVGVWEAGSGWARGPIRNSATG